LELKNVSWFNKPYFQMLRYLLVVTSFFYLSSCVGQQQLPVNQYSDAVVINNEIWGLTTDGKIRTFNLSDGSPVIKDSNNLAAIAAIAKDHTDNIIIADSSDRIREIDQKSFKAKTIGRCDTVVYALLFDGQNNCYALSAKGIVDINRHRTYVSNTSINQSVKYQRGTMPRPDAFFIDKNDNIWIGFGHGEWGGNMFVFNSRTKKFIKLNEYFKQGISPVKSIFEVNDDVYISTGLMHMAFSGSIIKLCDFKDTTVFESYSFQKNPDGTNRGNDAEYIGPATFNQFDKCIYFYSQHGIFKGDPKGDLSKIEMWHKIIQPKLNWTNGQSNAVGSPMNVSKLQFIDKDKLIFISKNDGIGLYDGSKLVMLQ
jgi:hypothetical protein